MSWETDETFRHGPFQLDSRRLGTGYSSLHDPMRISQDTVAPNRNPKRRYRLGLILIFGCALIAAHVLWLPRILVDDAFISYRYARNLVDGYGLTFNPPDRVEGYSNTLWVLLTALGLLCELDPVAWTRAIGAASLMGSLIVAVLLARRWIGTDRGALAVAFLIAASTALCGSSMTGLETGLYTFLVTASVACVVLDHPRMASVLMGLASITRPEGVGLCLIALCLCGLLRRREGIRRYLITLGVPCGMMVAAAHLFRLWYFGDWLPNSVRAKSAMLPLLLEADPAQWPGLIFNEPGRAYVGDFIRYAFGFVALFAFVPVMRTSQRRCAAAVMLGSVGMGLAVALYNFGDWMSSFRLLTPYLPILGVLVVRGVHDTIGWLRERNRIGLSAAARPMAAALLLYCAVGQFQWHRPSVANQPDAELAAVLTASRQPDLLAATDVLGRIGYLAPRVSILDMAGLTERHIARYGHPEPPFGRSDFEYVLERKPHLIMNNVRAAWTRHLKLAGFVEGYWWLDRTPWTRPAGSHTRPRFVFVRRGSVLEAEIRTRYPRARFRPPTDLGSDRG